MNILGNHCYLLVGLTLNLLIKLYDISRDGLDKFCHLLLLLEVRLNELIRWCHGALDILGNKLNLLLGLTLNLLIKLYDISRDGLDKFWHLLLLLEVRLNELIRWCHGALDVLGNKFNLLLGLTLDQMIRLYDISRDGLDKCWHLLPLLGVRLNELIRWCLGALVFLGNKVHLLMVLILNLLIRTCDIVRNVFNACWHILLLLGVGLLIWQQWQMQLLTKEVLVVLQNNEQHLRHLRHQAHQRPEQSNDAFDILNLYMGRFEMISKVSGWIFNAVTKLF
ncbi:uncharacterized protein RB166_010988 [Leptodactylus fuscus]|uniref:uncharacterized protein LOC142209163 n=1 Tax=Leptodactylus fuscus TaxID=238119 RepID=UPI003F4EA71A